LNEQHESGQEKRNGTKRRSDDRTRDRVKMTGATNVAAKVIERKMTIEGDVMMIAERTVAGKMIAGMTSVESKMTADEMTVMIAGEVTAMTVAEMIVMIAGEMSEMSAAVPHVENVHQCGDSSRLRADAHLHHVIALRLDPQHAHLHRVTALRRDLQNAHHRGAMHHHILQQLHVVLHLVLAPHCNRSRRLQ